MAHQAVASVACFRYSLIFIIYLCRAWHVDFKKIPDEEKLQQFKVLLKGWFVLSSVSD